MFLYKVCRGLELGFWLDFYMIEGFLQVLFVRSFFFFFVYFLGFDSFCSVSGSLGVSLWRGQRHV